jgi:hypothetical protein
MSDGAGDLSISQEAADLVTQGLRGAMDELRELAPDPDAMRGAGFAELALTKKEAGGGALADAFEEFCERWDWGVRALLHDAGALADRLGLAAGMVYEEDRYRETTFKVITNAVSPTGNPHLTEEELARQDWGDIFTPDVVDRPEPGPGRGGGPDPPGE